MKEIEKLNKLTADQDVTAIAEKADKLSPKGFKAFEAAVNEEYNKLSKLPKAKRLPRIESMIDGLLEKYLRKDLRPAKVKVDRRKPVVQVDKDGNFVAEHESVQAAHRNTGVSDGSICYCCRHEYGFKSAGGFGWMYKTEWLEKQAAPAEENKAAE